MTHYGLRFDAIESPRALRELGSFMRTHAGTYDRVAHEAWVEGTCLPAIARDERRAIAWWRDGMIVGDAVLKVVAPDVAELKNFRVADHGQLQGRGMGKFLLRQALYEATDLLVEKGMVSAETNSVRVQLDTTAGSEAQAFFAHHGFHQTGTAELYTPGQIEVLMQTAVELS